MLLSIFLVDSPLYNLDHPLVKGFMRKYSSHRMKSSSTARKKTLSSIYRNVMHEIRKKIGNNKFWFSIDGTTDLNGNHLFTFIIGSLNNLGESFVFNLWSLPSKSSENIKTFFEQTMQILYPMTPILNGMFDINVYYIFPYSLPIFFELCSNVQIFKL